MTQLAGIKTTKNAKGEYTSITINLKKHKNAIKPLIEIGLMEEDSFEKNWIDPNNLTVQEARKLSLKHIDSLPWIE